MEFEEGNLILLVGWYFVGVANIGFSILLNLFIFLGEY